MSLTYDPTEDDDDLEVHAADMGDPTGGDDDFTIEEQARARGWKAPGEPGAPANAIGAEEFLARGSDDPRILREENRRLGTQVARLGRKIERMEESNALSNSEHLVQLREMRALIARGENRQIDTKRIEITEARRGAIENGDVAAVDQFDEQLRALTPVEEAAPASPPPPPAPPGLPPEEKRIIDAWTAANPWYFADQSLRQAMMAAHSIVRVKHPGMGLAEQLEVARRRIVADFPDKFGIDEQEEDEPLPETPPVRRPAAAVGRPSGGAPPREGGARRTVWDQIPADEREIAKSSYQTGLRNDPDQPASEFVQLWLDPHLDVLELRRRRPKK